MKQKVLHNGELKTAYDYGDLTIARKVAGVIEILEDEFQIPLVSLLKQYQKKENSKPYGEISMQFKCHALARMMAYKMVERFKDTDVGKSGEFLPAIFGNDWERVMQDLTEIAEAHISQFKTCPAETYRAGLNK